MGLHITSVTPSMKDHPVNNSKLKEKNSGLWDADCITYAGQKSDWINEDCIRTNQWKYQWKYINKDGDIIKKQGDYKTRKGLANKPITASDQRSVCIIHSYIKVLS